MCDDDLARMLQGNLRPIVQLLSRYLPEYRMSLLTTKCLNTAIMVMYLALGDGALATTRQCDVEPVRKRRSGNDSRITDRAIAELLKARVLDPDAKGRWLHYVMLTDGNLPKAPKATAGAKEEIYFPGHVFVIESFPADGGARKYRFYQSYVNHYDVVQHTAMMHSSNGGPAASASSASSPDIGVDEVRRMLDGLIGLASKPVWDEGMSSFWSWFARVPRAHAEQFVGYRREGFVLMCHRHVLVDGCAQSLRSLAARALEDTRHMHDPDAVWGDPSLYDSANGAKPLTVREMFAVLQRWV